MHWCGPSLPTKATTNWSGDEDRRDLVGAGRPHRGQRDPEDAPMCCDLSQRDECTFANHHRRAHDHRVEACPLPHPGDLPRQAGPDRARSSANARSSAVGQAAGSASTSHLDGDTADPAGHVRSLIGRRALGPMPSRSQGESLDRLTPVPPRCNGSTRRRSPLGPDHAAAPMRRRRRPGQSPHASPKGPKADSPARSTASTQPPVSGIPEWPPRQESNLYLALRRRSFYPLNYGGSAAIFARTPGARRRRAEGTGSSRECHLSCHVCGQSELGG